MSKQIAQQQKQQFWPDFFDDDWFFRPFNVPSFRSLTRDIEQWTPRCDISETKDSFVVHAELPGLKKEEVQVHYDNENRLLSIKGENKSEKKEENEKYYRVERKYGKFERHFTLPKNANGETIGANMHDGVLELTIPKLSEEQSKKTVKNIQIN